MRCLQKADVSLNIPVLLFTLAFDAAGGEFCAECAPALQTWKTNLIDYAEKKAGRTGQRSWDGTALRAGRWWVVEFALALTLLLAGAGVGDS